VLEWIFNRVTDKAEAVDTPIGAVPTPDAIDTDGLDVSRDQMEELLRIDTEGWRAEVPLIEEYYAKFGDRLPQALADQAKTLGERLG
jgi:phosphoenolpyruvate carboxykinase (GTP)